MFNPLLMKANFEAAILVTENKDSSSFTYNVEMLKFALCSKQAEALSSLMPSHTETWRDWKAEMNGEQLAALVDKALELGLLFDSKEGQGNYLSSSGDFIISRDPKEEPRPLPSPSYSPTPRSPRLRNTPLYVPMLY